MSNIDKMVTEAISTAWPVESHSIKFIRRGMNLTYYGKLKDNREVYFRVQDALLRSQHWILAEIDFINYLHQHQYPTCQLLFTKTAHPFHTIQCEKKYFISAFIKLPGKEIQITNPKQYQAKSLQQFGRQMALLHQMSSAYKPKHHSRPDFKNYLYQTPHHTIKKTMLNYAHYFFEELNMLEKNEQNYGLLHGDFKFDNLRLDQNTFHVFDFDCCFYYWYVADFLLPLKIYFTLPGLGFYPTNKNQLHFFLSNSIKGYREERELSLTQLQLLPLLIKGSYLRAYFELNYITDFDEYDSHTLMTHIEKMLLEDHKIIDFNFAKLLD